MVSRDVVGVRKKNSVILIKKNGHYPKCADGVVRDRPVHPAPSHPGGRAACAAPCPRASERSQVKFVWRCVQWGKLPCRPRDFANPAFGAQFRCCGGRVCVLDRTKCQTGGWLAFGSDKCGWLRSLTTRVCACVLVAVEMPFSSTFSAAAGATEVL